MTLIAKLLIAFVALEHLYILWLEMFAWTTAGRRTFKSMSADMFEKTKSMAANQGLYNGFLAAGLIWSLIIQDEAWSKNVAIFFLGCVLIAGIYGAVSVQKSIFYVQGIPAILSLAAVILL
jgi:putative membrane protein